MTAAAERLKSGHGLKLKRLIAAKQLNTADEREQAPSPFNFNSEDNAKKSNYRSQLQLQLRARRHGRAGRRAPVKPPLRAPPPASSASERRIAFCTCAAGADGAAGWNRRRQREGSDWLFVIERQTEWSHDFAIRRRCAYAYVWSVSLHSHSVPLISAPSRRNQPDTAASQPNIRPRGRSPTTVSQETWLRSHGCWSHAS